MRRDLQSVCRLAALSFCCALIITVRESDSTYVPGRCLCPVTNDVVRGTVKDLNVIAKSPNCNKVTVIVDLKNGQKVCVNPKARLGKYLTRCWNRANRMNRNVKNCLHRRKMRRGLQNQRTQ